MEADVGIGPFRRSFRGKITRFVELLKHYLRNRDLLLLYLLLAILLAMIEDCEPANRILLETEISAQRSNANTESQRIWFRSNSRTLRRAPK